MLAQLHGAAVWKYARSSYLRAIGPVVCGTEGIDVSRNDSEFEPDITLYVLSASACGILAILCAQGCRGRRG